MPGRVAHGTYAHDLGRRHPFEVAMLSVAAIIGASRLLAHTSGTLERALPDLLVITWYVLLTLSSVTGLVGIFWREPVTGLLIERAGMSGMFASCIVYTTVLIAFSGWAAVAAAGFVLGFAVAALIRALDIGRMLVRIRALAVATEAVLKEGEPKE